MENGNEQPPYYMQGLVLPWSWKKKARTGAPLVVELDL